MEISTRDFASPLTNPLGTPVPEKMRGRGRHKHFSSEALGPPNTQWRYREPRAPRDAGCEARACSSFAHACIRNGICGTSRRDKVDNGATPNRGTGMGGFVNHRRRERVDVGSALTIPFVELHLPLVRPVA